MDSVQKLFDAIDESDLEEVKRLIEVEKIDIDSVIKLRYFDGSCFFIHQHTPLSYAAEYDLDIIIYLLNKGSDINKGNALVVAANKGHVNIVKELLVRGADPLQKLEEGGTFLDNLFYKAYSGDIDSGMAEMILSIATFDKGCELKPVKK